MTYSNNFSFDYLNMCKICDISPHPDIIKLYYYKLIKFYLENQMKKLKNVKKIYQKMIKMNYHLINLKQQNQENQNHLV